MVDTPGPGGIPVTPTPGGQATPMLEGTPGAQTPPAPVTPPPAPAPAPTATAPWKDGEVWKIGDKEWWEYIPEEPVRDLMKAKQYANPAVASVAYANLNKLQNGNDGVIALPPKDATPEQLQAFDKTLRTKLGVPETPDKYDFKAGENADPKFVEFGKTMFHKIGIPPAKAQEFVDEWNKFVGTQKAETLAAETQRNDQEVTALETRWGAELPVNLAAGRSAMQQLGLSADLVDRIESKVGTAAVVELLATIGKKTSEAGWQGSGGGNGGSEVPETMSKEGAQAKIAALNIDAEFQTKYTDKNHPEHKNAVDFMERLHRRSSAAS